MEKGSSSGSGRGRDKGKGPASSSSLSPSSSSSAPLETKHVATARTAAGGKLERMVGWVSSGLHTAFFISMDKCSCVKLDTLEEPILLHRPLLLSENRGSFSAETENIMRRSNSYGGVEDDDGGSGGGSGNDLPPRSRKRDHKPRSDLSKPATR